MAVASEVVDADARAKKPAKDEEVDEACAVKCASPQCWTTTKWANCAGVGVVVGDSGVYLSLQAFRDDTTRHSSRPSHELRALVGFSDRRRGPGA